MGSQNGQICDQLPSSPELFEDHSDFDDNDDDFEDEESNVKQILSSIRGLIKIESSCENDWDFCVLDVASQGSNDQLIHNLCSKIGLLTSEEFSNLEDQLFLFLIKEWPLRSCFQTLEFVTDIFSYICTIVPSQEIVEEYLIYFSQPSMPPHIRLYVYPTVLDIANKRFPKRFENDLLISTDYFITAMERYQFFSTTTEKASSIASSRSAEFVTFWKSTFKFYITTESPEFETKLLTAFVCCHLKFTEVCVVDEHLMTMFKVFAKCMQDKPNRTTLLLTSLFILFLRSLVFSPKSMAGIKFLTSKLKSATSHFKQDEIITTFVTSAITSFVQSIGVENESLIPEATSLHNSHPTGINEDPKIEAAHSSSTHEKTDDSASTDGHHANVVSGSGSGIVAPGSQKRSNHIQSSTIGNGNNKSPAASEKTLELLGKLVNKMITTKVKLTAESDKDKLRSLISDLNTFL